MISLTTTRGERRVAQHLTVFMSSQEAMTLLLQQLTETTALMALTDV